VSKGILARKVGMTQVFTPQGTSVPVTVLEADTCRVVQRKTVPVDGYEAVQLGFGAIKDDKVNQPMRGHFRASGGQFKYLREFQVDDIEAWKVGQRVAVDMFQPGDRVDVTAVSKGRGFAGGVKRHGFHGGPKTHGQSDRHRAPGSIGSTTTPGRVLKGLRMAGHMGDRQVTVRNLVVLESNPARGILLLAGAVPGGANGLVRIRRVKSDRG